MPNLPLPVLYGGVAVLAVVLIGSVLYKHHREILGFVLHYLRGELHGQAAKTAEKEILRYIKLLKKMNTDEIAMLVAVSTIVRLNMEDQRLFPSANFPDLFKKSIDLELQKTLNKLAKSLKKSKKKMDAAAVMVWLHSVRALNMPEVRDLGIEMWALLQSGFPRVPNALKELDKVVTKKIPDRVRGEYRFVPFGLEPKKVAKS